MSSLVKRIEPTRSVLRRKPPTANGNTAMVYVTRNRMYVAERALTASEVWFNPPHTAYLVDIGFHSTDMRLKLPSRVEAFAFDAEVSVGWQVASPLEAIDGGLEDGETVIRPLIIERLRELSRKYAEEDSAGAERAINEAFGRRVLKFPHGLTVNWCLASVNLDRDVQAHSARETRAGWAAKERDLKHRWIVRDAQLARVEVVEKDEVNTLLDEQRIDRDTRSKLHELAMKQLTIDFYTKLIDQGQLGLLKARLAEHPEDVDSVLTFMVNERQSAFEKDQTLWEMAVNHGLASPTQVSGLLGKMTTEIVAHVASYTTSELSETGPVQLAKHADTVEGEVVEESEDAGGSDTEDDEDDNPI